MFLYITNFLAALLAQLIQFIEFIEFIVSLRLRFKIVYVPQIEPASRRGLEAHITNPEIDW